MTHLYRRRPVPIAPQHIFARPAYRPRSTGFAKRGLNGQRRSHRLRVDECFSCPDYRTAWCLFAAQGLAYAISSLDQEQKGIGKLLRIFDIELRHDRMETPAHFSFGLLRGESSRMRARREF